MVSKEVANDFSEQHWMVWLLRVSVELRFSNAVSHLYLTTLRPWQVDGGEHVWGSNEFGCLYPSVLSLKMKLLNTTFIKINKSMGQFLETGTGNA